MDEKAIQDFSDSLGQLILLWQRIRRDILMTENVTPADKRILYGLYRGGEMTKSELAKAIVLEHSSLTRSVIRLEKNGLLSRITSESDHRYVQLSLTEKGVSKTLSLRKQFLEKIKPTFPEIPQKKLEEITGFLKQINKKTGETL